MNRYLQCGIVFRMVSLISMTSFLVISIQVPVKDIHKAHYKLTDPFCIFYLRFVDNYDSLPDIFWQQNVTSQRINVWRGYSFENVCFGHISQIKRALGISGVSTTHSAWSNTIFHDYAGLHRCFCHAAVTADRTCMPVYK